MESGKALEILSLLRLALWQDASIPARVPQDDARWREMIDIAAGHLVLPLLGDCFDLLDETERPQRQIMADCLVEQEYTQRKNAHLTLVARRLINFFRSHGLNPVVLKGPVIAAYYKHPQHRHTGDIDIYFADTEWNDAIRLIEKSSGSEHLDKSPDGSVCFITEDETVELHPFFYDGSCDFPELDKNGPEGFLVMLDMHILKHCLSSNVRLKQLCDYTVARYAFKFDREKVTRSLQEAGLGKWQTLLDRFADYLRYGNDNPENLTAVNTILKMTPDFSKSKATLKKSARKNKLRTLSGFIKAIPFALRYAPKEWWHTVRELVRGNLAD